MGHIQTSEMNAKFLPVNVEPWNFVYWYIFKGKTTFNETISVKTIKYECGVRLKVKIIFFLGDNSWNVAHQQMKFGTVKDRGNTYKFYLNHHFLTKLLSMWMVRTFEVMLGQALNDSV
jgi:hypothetical protein